MTVEQDLVKEYNNDDEIFRIWETKRRKKKLEKLYPELSDSGLDITMQIREQNRDYLKKGGFEDWHQAETYAHTYPHGGSLYEKYYVVADNVINKEGQAMLYLFDDIKSLHSPETADTLRFYVDPEMFEGIKAGDHIKGFSMFNVMQYGYKLEK